MIPTGGQVSTQIMEETQQPSRTWKLDLEKNRIVGMIDGLEAYKQAVFKVMRTERFKYLIYSFDYGIELDLLIGKNPVFVRSELRRRIHEALQVFDWYRGIENLTFEGSDDSLSVEFTVITDLGNFLYRG